jgi:hypothetical protein
MVVVACGNDYVRSMTKNQTGGVTPHPSGQGGALGKEMKE